MWKTIESHKRLVNEICNFIKLFPKRLSLFEDLQECNSATPPSLKPLCPTRWTVRASAVLSVLTNYKVLLDELDEIGENEIGEASPKATCLCVSREQFQNYFGLKLSYMVFVAVEQLAITLQSKDISAELCNQAVKMATQFPE